MTSHEEWKSLQCLGLPAYSILTERKVKNVGTKRMLKGRIFKGEHHFRLKKIDGTFVKLTVEELMKVFNESPSEDKPKCVEPSSSDIDETTDEVWRSLDFLDFSKYEISNHQRCRNIQNHNLVKGSLEYSRHVLCLTNDVGKKITVKRYNMIMHAFRGIPRKDQTVDHINRIANDDRLSNLRYTTINEQGLNRSATTIKKKIVQQFKNNIKTRTFIDAEEACKIVGGHVSDMHKACFNRRSYKEFEWCYLENLDLPGEIWKDGTERFPEIKSFMVSNLGRIRRHRGTTEGSLLNSYYRVGLLHHDEIYRSKGINRLVCGTFSDKRRDDLQVNHIDGVKKNNRFENLEYVTRPENVEHALNTGLTNTRKPVKQFSMQGEFISEFNSMHEAEKKTGIPHGNISKVCINKERSSAGGYRWSFSGSIMEMKSTRSSPVNQLDSDGNVIKTFKSMVQVTRELPIYLDLVRKVCQGKLKSAKGYYFSFVYSEDINRQQHKTKPLNQLSLNGDLIATFSSVPEASKDLNIPEDGISRACRISCIFRHFKFEYI
uniref:HNH endonuclease n=1 Tax=Pithovirus LCPAC403 TaxID=2506596 RepID=A0A481ZAZ9_9VIRU|nr:MAG: HNH endonuclease [Pithovirus LCPAC403]